MIAVRGGAADLPSAEAIFRNVRRFLPSALSVAAGDDKQVCYSLAIASKLGRLSYLSAHTPMHGVAMPIRPILCLDHAMKR